MVDPIDTVKDGHTYVYRVRTDGRAGYSPWSDPVSVNL